jgi:hypothetical protein
MRIIKTDSGGAYVCDHCASRRKQKAKDKK